jgi:hypothetical protein
LSTEIQAIDEELAVILADERVASGGVPGYTRRKNASQRLA